MSDAICDDDRRLIEEAVARGRITHIPRGVSGVPLPVWSGGKLVSQDPQALKKSQDRLWRKMRQPDPKLMERRRNVGKLFHEGLTTEQIAIRLETPVSTIKKDLKIAGLKRERPKPVPPQMKPQAVRPSQAKRDLAAKLYRESKNTAEISEVVGVHANRVRVYLREVFGPLQWDRNAAAKKASATKKARRG